MSAHYYIIRNLSETDSSSSIVNMGCQSQWLIPQTINIWRKNQRIHVAEVFMQTFKFQLIQLLSSSNSWKLLNRFSTQFKWNMGTCIQQYYSKAYKVSELIENGLRERNWLNFKFSYKIKIHFITLPHTRGFFWVYL